MANITGTVKDVQSSAMVAASAPSWIYFNDGYAPALSGGSPGVIHPVGVIPAGLGMAEVPGTNTKLYLVHSANTDIATYETLATRPATGSQTLDQIAVGTTSSSTLEEWATNPGTMNGKSINAGQTMDFNINARRETGSVEDAHLELKFYHRTTGGTETLLDTVVLADLTTTYQDFAGTWSVASDRAFGSNELLVLKTIMYNDGAPV